MNGLYPEPPHLAVAVYPGLDEEGAFAAMCGVAEAAGCRPQGLVEVAPWDRAFELRSDLAEVASKLQVDPARFRSVVAGERETGRPVRAGYVHDRYGLVVVTYLAAPAGDRHPIAISLAAGPLGVPEAFWSAADRRAAGRLARWTANLLRSASSRTEAPYAGIGVEYTLATPSDLVRGVSTLPAEVFVSRALLVPGGRLDAALRQDYGAVEEAVWGHGTFLSAWAPYNARKVTLPGIPERFRNSSVALGEAMRSAKAT